MPQHVLKVVERDFPELQPMIESFYDNLVNEKNTEKAPAAMAAEDEDDKQEAPFKAEEAPAEGGLMGQKRAREEDEPTGEEAAKQPKTEESV